MAEVGDLLVSIVLNTPEGSITHVRRAVTPFKDEHDSAVSASLKEINTELNDRLTNRKVRTLFSS